MWTLLKRVDLFADCIGEQQYKELADFYYQVNPEGDFIPPYALWAQDKKFVEDHPDLEGGSWSIGSPILVFENEGRILPIRLFLDVDDANVGSEPGILHSNRVVPCVPGHPWFEGVLGMFINQFTAEELAELGLVTVAEGSTMAMLNINEVPKRFSRYHKDREDCELEVAMFWPEERRGWTHASLVAEPAVVKTMESFATAIDDYEDYWLLKGVHPEVIYPYNIPHIIRNAVWDVRPYFTVELTTPCAGQGIAFFYQESDTCWYWYGSSHNGTDRIGNRLLIEGCRVLREVYHGRPELGDVTINLGVDFFPWKRMWTKDKRPVPGLRFTAEPKTLHALIDTVQIPDTDDGLFHKYLPHNLVPATA